jgi:hypothetical protein
LVLNWTWNRILGLSNLSTLTLWSQEANPKQKNQVKGGGQECPLPTDLLEIGWTAGSERRKLNCGW